MRNSVSVCCRAQSSSVSNEPILKVNHRFSMKNTNQSLRQQWVAYWKAAYAAWEAGCTNYPSLPDELHDLRCGAKTRAGTPCRMKILFGNGRCKLHGGLSSGPKSEAGKARSSQNWRGSKFNDEPHEILKKPDFQEFQNTNTNDGSDSQRVRGGLLLLHGAVQSKTKQAVGVRCVDCQNLSAAHTCMKSLGAGISMGQIRECNQYVESSSSIW